jgi:hypothetical protein
LHGKQSTHARYLRLEHFDSERTRDISSQETRALIATLRNRLGPQLWRAGNSYAAEREGLEWMFSDPECNGWIGEGFGPIVSGAETGRSGASGACFRKEDVITRHAIKGRTDLLGVAVRC